MDSFERAEDRSLQEPEPRRRREVDQDSAYDEYRETDEYARNVAIGARSALMREAALERVAEEPPDTRQRMDRRGEGPRSSDRAARRARRNLGVIVNARDNTGGDEMKSRQVSFSVPSHAYELIAKIADRARAESPADGYARTNYMALCMDLTAAHANGCPLRLEDLLAADSLNFWHDVAGIVRHLDRKTGRLGDCFVPRFAAQ